ncbi:MAG: cell division protein ZapA [Burkholderiaceae bacterium]|nr:cell division protein ZapA [Burkholderiaceae bacterium]
MKQIEVQIMSQSYLLGCPEGGEAHLMAAVEKVDTAMCKIRDAAKIKARERIAVLAALNLAFEQTETKLADAAPAANPAPSDAAHEPGEDMSLNHKDSHSLNLLIHKLDAALADDGRLF